MLAPKNVNSCCKFSDVLTCANVIGHLWNICLSFSKFLDVLTCTNVIGYLWNIWLGVNIFIHVPWLDFNGSFIFLKTLRTSPLPSRSVFTIFVVSYFRFSSSLTRALVLLLSPFKLINFFYFLSAWFSVILSLKILSLKYLIVSSCWNFLLLLKIFF